MGQYVKRLGKLHVQAVEKGQQAGARFVLSSLRARTVQVGKRDQGGVYRGWRSRPRRTRAGMVTDFYNVSPHFKYVEGGRRRNRPMPPVRALEEWARRRLGVVGLGWAIAKAIAKRGIAPTPILNTRAFRKRMREIMMREIDRRVAEAARRARV